MSKSNSKLKIRLKMKNVILIFTATVLFLASGCKKESTVQPKTIVCHFPILKADTAADMQLQSSGLGDPVLLSGSDSMITITLRMRVLITAHDSDIYIPRSIPTDTSIFKIHSRGNVSIASPSGFIQQPVSNVTIQSTGNLKIEAHETVVLNYAITITTHANRGEYQLQLYTIPCSVDKDDNSFESKVIAGPDCKTEWISTLYQ